MLDRFNLAYGVYQTVRSTNRKGKERILEAFCSVKNFL